MPHTADNNIVTTKKDIKMLRVEFKRAEKAIRQEVLRVEEKIESLDEKVDNKFDDVMTKLDGIAKGVDDLRTENVAGVHHTRQLRVEVNNHEKRIKHLESPT